MNASPQPTDWPVTRFLWIGFVALTVALGGFGNWIMRTSIAGAIVTSGQFEILQEPQIIQHQTGGVIKRLLVREGDFVGPDELLIQLDATRTLSDIDVVEYKLNEVIARQTRWRAEKNGRAVHFSDRLQSRAETDPRVAVLLMDQQELWVSSVDLQKQIIEGMHNRSSQIRIRLLGLNTQKQALEAQKNLLGQQLQVQKTLTDKGLAPVVTVLAIRREMQGLSGQNGALIAEIAQSKEQLIGVEIEVLRMRAARKEKTLSRLQELEFQEVRLIKNLQQLQQELEKHALRTPIAGTVLGLAALSAQSVILPGKTLLTIVPQTRVFVIRTRLAPVNIDQVFPGQTAHIRLSMTGTIATSTPEFTATVRTISADTQRDSLTGRVYYDVELALPAAQLLTSETLTRPTPGMPVEVFFRTTDQPVWAYLTKPLRTYFARAFRES
ncbi:MAG: HlyD family type I secretion periplasmic adaptor subunit [Paracoccaceae bacterium]